MKWNIKYGLLVLFMAACQLSLAQEQEITLALLQGMKSDSLVVDRKDGRYTLISGKSSDFYKDSLSNDYALKTDAEVIFLSHKLGQKVNIYKNEFKEIRIFGDRPEGFKEDNDTVTFSHSIKENEKTYLLLGIAGKREADTLASVGLGTNDSKIKLHIIYSAPESAGGTDRDSLVVAPNNGKGGKTGLAYPFKPYIWLLIVAVATIISVLVYLLRIRKVPQTSDLPGNDGATNVFGTDGTDGKLCNIDTDADETGKQENDSENQNETEGMAEAMPKKDYEKAIAELTDVLTGLQKDLARLTDEKSDLETKLKAEQDAHLADVKEQKELAKEQYNQLYTEYSALREQYSDEVDAWNQEREELLQEKDSKLTEQKEAYEHKISWLQKQHESEKKETGEAVEKDKERFIRSIQENLYAIGTEIINLKKSVGEYAADNIVKFFIDNMERGLKNADKSLTTIADKLGEYRTSGDLAAAVRILIISEWMSSDGLVNTVALLAAYCRIPEVACAMGTQGIDSSVIAYIQARLSALLGAAGVSLLIPNILADDFDAERYDYLNMETRIDLICTDLNASDYRRKVFDMSEVGYVTSESMKKPKVKYF